KSHNIKANHLQADRLLYEIFKEQLRSYKLIIRGVVDMVEELLKKTLEELKRENAEMIKEALKNTYAGKPLVRK
ncbi:hypothetical protein, partial [Listeria newyorkensis]|uniref:hypothetical protein n=2 Tax=Listeria newyorkensis TaxID=1497681 RepID=UPI001BB15D12